MINRLIFKVMSDENSKTGTEVGNLTDEPVSVGRSAQQPTQAPSQPEPQNEEPGKQGPLLGLVGIPVFEMEDTLVMFDMEVRDYDSSSDCHTDVTTSLSPEARSLFRVPTHDIRPDTVSTSRAEERENPSTAPEAKS